LELDKEEHVMSRVVWGGLLAASVGLSGCGSPYLKAAGKFADTAATTTATLQGVVDFNHTLCKKRAQIDYLQHRLMGNNTVDGRLPPLSPMLYWGDWYRQFKPAAGNTWSDHCKATQVSDALVNKAISALGDYAAALKTVAGDDYSGKNIGALVSDVSALVGQIPGAPTEATNAVKALGPGSADAGPIGKLGGALKQAYAAKQVKEIVNSSGEPVKAILKSLNDYLTAVDKEETQWENDTTDALSTIDQLMDEKPAASAPEHVAAPAPASEPPTRPEKGKPGRAAALPPAPPAPAAAAPAPASAARPPLRINPLHTLEFYRIADRWTQTLDATQTKQGALADALQKLTAAHDKLVAAQGKDEAPELTDVLGLIGEVLNDIAAVQTAMKGGASQ
jgi:hypothetical protein